MMKWIKDFASLRLVLLLWLFAIGGASVWADDTSSSNGNSNAIQEDVKTYDFTTSESQALLSGLGYYATDWNTTNNHVSISINGYPVTLHRCLRGTNTLVVRGGGTTEGYVEGTWQGTLTQITLKTVGNASQDKGTVSIIVTDKDGTAHTTTKQVTGTGTYTIDISADDQVEDAQSIRISPDFRCNLSQISLKRRVGAADTSKRWVTFKKWTGEAYSEEEGQEANVGQILKLESNGIEGFDPVSTSTNPYVVVYTVDGNEPVFSFVQSNGNWKNGNDSYIYRRGIVLDKYNHKDENHSIGGETITVKLKIYQLTADDNGNFTSYTEVKDQYISQTFKLVATEGRAVIEAGTTDISYNPSTNLKTFSTKYSTAMKILDPTQHVIVSEAGDANGYTIIAKFSQNDRYDFQSLFNATNVTPAIGQKSMKTSSTGVRTLSTLFYSATGVASDGIAEATYWFIPTRTQLNYEMKAEPATIDLAQGKNQETTKVTVKGYYTDSDGYKQYVNLKDEIGLKKSHISVGDKQVFNLITSTATDGTTGDIIFADDGKTAWFTIQGYDNGTSAVTIKTQETNNGTVEGEMFKPASINYTAATGNLSITVTGSNKLAAPTITPSSRYYSKTFNAKVKGVTGLKTYYLLYSPSANQGEISLQSDDDTSNSSEGEGETEEDETDKTLDPLEIPAQSIVDIAKDFQYDETNPDYLNAGVIDGDKEVELEIEAMKGNVLHVIAVVAEVGDDGKIIKKTVTSTDGNTTEEAEQASRVVQSAYAFNTLETPVLSPGIAGDSHIYPYNGETLTISANVESPNCQIYYLVGNNEKLTLTQNEDGTIHTNGTLYDAEQNFTISGTTMVQALAYSTSLGLASDVVNYRYANVTTEIDPPTFSIEGKDYQSGEKLTTSIEGKSIILKAKAYAEDGSETEIGGENVKWDTDIYHIYYTTDGTYPTSQSLQYKGAITDIDNSGKDVTIIAMAYANGTDANGNKGDGSISNFSSIHLLNGNVNYWETTTENCPNGVLTNKEQAITKDGETVVNIEFGGKDAEGNNMSWQHYASGEYGTGDPIDNVGYYTIAPANTSTSDVDFDADVRDEAGNLWNHSKSNDGTSGFQTHKATFGLPASGAYVKFEPKKSGKLTIWCCQEGALYYNNKSSQQERFNEGFLRKRPAYFVDEAGKSIKPAETPVAAGVLSSNWVKRTTQGSWNKKGDNINGIEQKLYTQEQTSMIYEMFNEKILATGTNWNEPIQPLIVYLNTEKNKKVAGFNVAEDPRNEGETEATKAYATDNIIDETGVCLPSASYMKYTFDVKAGKTYFFFGWMTKIGIRGFGFEPSTEAASQDAPTIFSGKSATSAGGDSGSNDFTECKDKTYAEVTLQREFDADKWTSLVLPFSVSASQVKEVFGDGTEILHYRTIEDRTMYFFHHFHQMIVAGTPILIKPAKAYKGTSLPKFTNVTFEKVETGNVTDKPCNDYGYKGKDGKEVVNTDCQMIASYKTMDLYDGNYFVGTDGKVHLLKGATGGYTKLSGTNAYIIGKTDDGTQTSLTNMAKAAYNNLTPVDMDSEVTGISFIDADGNVSPIVGIHGKIYNLNGQIVSQDDKGVKSLPKGVYIVNGKKVVIE